MKERKPGDEFAFITDRAREAGAVEARIIPAERIIVEDRVRLKCRAGCPSYGKYLTCPPHAPAPEEFRRALREYRAALIVKFASSARLDESVRCCTLRSLYDPEAPQGRKDAALRFMKELADEGARLHRVMLELEQAAFSAGFPFALATIAGSCRLCGTCNAAGCCNHPTMSRFPPEALGINVVKTAEGAGMPIRFPAPENPDRIAILLID